MWLQKWNESKKKKENSTQVSNEIYKTTKKGKG